MSFIQAGSHGRIIYSVSDVSMKRDFIGWLMSDFDVKQSWGVFVLGAFFPPRSFYAED